MKEVLLCTEFVSYFFLLMSKFQLTFSLPSRKHAYIILTPTPHSLLYSKTGVYMGICLFVCVEVLRPSQPRGVMSSAFSLPNHMFTGQA